MLGTWQLQFTSATAGTIFAPGGNSYPFTIDPSLAVAIANPITVNFGINPAVDTNMILGETVVVSQIGIAGVDPLSTNYSTIDNFLTDSTLDPATWTVNALFPGSIVFVTTNDVYSVNWTLPGHWIFFGSEFIFERSKSVGCPFFIVKRSPFPGNEYFDRQEQPASG